jgi:hypothetical protein
MALVGNFVSSLKVKSETESVTPDTGFRFNSKDWQRCVPPASPHFTSPMTLYIFSLLYHNRST